MRAELVFLGRRVNMASQRRRRMAVAAMYALLAVLMVAGWFLDQWKSSGIFFVFYGAFFANFFLLGGNAPSGLVKPFTGKGPKTAAMPSSVLELKLRSYAVRPDEEQKNYRNDERELEQRDRAHYRAYQTLGVIVGLHWAAMDLCLHAPRLLRYLPIPAELLVYGLLLVCMVLILTLPQSILLWNEPDMQE